jgi:phospholipase A1
LKQFNKAIILLTLVIACALPSRLSAQIVATHSETVNTDSLRRAFADQHYYFGLYKDNYFIFGPSVQEKPSRSNTNVKFQISIAQKLTKSTLPWGTYLYLFYSQKVFWNVLENSMPMTDLNFNPGIGLTKPLFIKDRFIGKLSMILEHESNGRDGDESRSWNKVTFAGSIMVDPNFVVNGRFWIPIIDGVNNSHYQPCSLAAPKAGSTITSTLKPPIAGLPSRISISSCNSTAATAKDSWSIKPTPRIFASESSLNQRFSANSNHQHS